MLADEDDRDGVERDADQQRAPHGGSIRTVREERHVQRDHQGGLDEDEVDPERRPEANAEEAGDRVDGRDDHEPQRRPVEHPGLVRVPALVQRRESCPPEVDV